MTTVSTVLAVGMMPLNLFFYSRSWMKDALVIPYINILYSFLMAVCPALAGIFLRWKWKKVADFVVKCGSYAGALSVVLTLVLMSIMYPFMYKVSWKIYVGAFLLSLVGFAFGFAVASVFRMTYTRRRTVALETGVQNFPLCMTLLNLTYEKEKFAVIALLPLMYGVTSLLSSTLFFLLYKIYVIIHPSEKVEDKEFEMKESNKN